MAWGEPWTIEELSTAVAAYDEMLTLELAGEPYVKARIRERYLDGPLDGRSKRSFEERMATYRLYAETRASDNRRVQAEGTCRRRSN
jgi:hypothetical protein